MIGNPCLSRKPSPGKGGFATMPGAAVIQLLWRHLQVEKACVSILFAGDNSVYVYSINTSKVFDFCQNKQFGMVNCAMKNCSCLPARLHDR